MKNESRREFFEDLGGGCLRSGDCGTSPGGSIVAPAPGEAVAIKKGIWMEMLPGNLSYAEQMKMAREVGFEVMQAPTQPDERKAEELRKAADAAGIQIDSVMNMDHWKYPMSSSDPAVVEKSLAGMRTSMRNAKVWGAEVVLLVPAVLDPKTSYREAWVRSQRRFARCCRSRKN